MNKGTFDNIGKFTKKTRDLDINADQKRFWLGEIESIDSRIMNDSMPISMNYFEKEIV